MRLCNATGYLRESDEVVLTNKTFKGWQVRYFRTAGGFDSEIWHKGKAVSREDMTQQFLAALLQNEEWEVSNRPT